MILHRFMASAALCLWAGLALAAPDAAPSAPVDPGRADSITAAVMHFVDRWAGAAPEVQQMAIVWAGVLLALLILGVFGGRAYLAWLTHRPATATPPVAGHSFDELFAILNSVSERVDQLAADLHQHIGGCRAGGG